MVLLINPSKYNGKDPLLLPVVFARGHLTPYTTL
jgi:hypothetical protein